MQAFRSLQHGTGYIQRDERRESMNGKRLRISWLFLVVALVVGGCGRTPTAPDESTPGPAFARDAALTALGTEGEAVRALDWTEEDLTPQDLVGSSTMHYTAGEWEVTVTYPIVAPEATTYRVHVANTASGLSWDGEVDAEGNVSAGVREDTGLPNPASAYCEEQGGTLEIRSGEGGQVGVCVFADGSECDEWAFFRGECAPGDSAP
jgi:putative hemolysin